MAINVFAAIAMFLAGLLTYAYDDQSFFPGIVLGLFLGECAAAGAWSALAPCNDSDSANLRHPTNVGVLWAIAAGFAVGVPISPCWGPLLLGGLSWPFGWLPPFLFFRGICSWLGLRLAIPEEQPAVTKWSFGVRDLMLLTAAIGVDIALIRGAYFDPLNTALVGGFGAMDLILGNIIVYLVINFALPVVATVGILKGDFRLTVLGMVLAVGIPALHHWILIWLSGATSVDFDRFLLAANGSLYLLTIANLLAVRLGGYRLVRR